MLFPSVVVGVEEESMPVYDTDIEDVIEEEEGFFRKGGFGGEEDIIEDVVVVANDLRSLMIQNNLSVDFSKTTDSNPYELIWSQKGFKAIKVQGRVIIKKRNLDTNSDATSQGASDEIGSIIYELKEQLD
nr:hypothetical protein [Tanacetum cinerariifolium]